MAKTDTKGTDAKIAPINVLRLEISDISTMRNVVITVFYYIVDHSLSHFEKTTYRIRCKFLSGTVLFKSLQCKEIISRYDSPRYNRPPMLETHKVSAYQHQLFFYLQKPPPIQDYPEQ